MNENDHEMELEKEIEKDDKKVNFYDLENMILNRKLSLLAKHRPTIRKPTIKKIEFQKPLNDGILMSARDIVKGKNNLNSKALPDEMYATP